MIVRIFKPENLEQKRQSIKKYGMALEFERFILLTFPHGEPPLFYPKPLPPMVWVPGR